METRFPCLQTRFGARNTWEPFLAHGKAREVPGRAVFLTTVPVFGRVGISWTPVRPGVGIIGAGYGIICYRCLGREGNGGVDQGARLVTELSESGAGDEANHEHRRARLARHSCHVTRTCGWRLSGEHSTRSLRTSAVLNGGGCLPRGSRRTGAGRTICQATSGNRQ
jgi:hypothetical protein